MASSKGATTCNVCGSPNRPGNRFCANCGVPLMDSPPDLKEIATERHSQSPPAGEHHYHHQYHHHYFSSADGINQAVPAEPRVSSGPSSARDFQFRAPSGGSLSRSETAMRKLTHDWALACNGKHLEDLVSLYIADGLVLRSNIPPVRGTAAIRESFSVSSGPAWEMWNWSHCALRFSARSPTRLAASTCLSPLQWVSAVKNVEST